MKYTMLGIYWLDITLLVMKLEVGWNTVIIRNMHSMLALCLFQLINHLSKNRTLLKKNNRRKNFYKESYNKKMKLQKQKKI